MELNALEQMLRGVEQGTVSVEEATKALAAAPFDDLGYAKPDHHRAIRQGVSEVIYGAGKTAEQIVGIAEALVRGGSSRVLVTRLEAEKAHEAQDGLAKRGIALTYHEIANLATIGDAPEPDGLGYIAICAAGTSDLYCAEEAAITAEMLGNRVMRLYDVGVAGLHRLLAHLEDIQGASVVVAVAGMEGALASVVGGLVAAPVIACPTSVGYGASFNGMSALLSMLNSCASGVSVVNIDNGFGAGYQASLINHMGAKC